MNVGFISLGCSKNLVDTEMTIGLMIKKGMKIVNNPKEADMIVINTCGFITSAKEEAIATILEMAEYKKKRCQYLVVMGCLVERYQQELKKEMPEVDLFLSIGEYDSLWEKIEKLIGKKSVVEEDNTLSYMDRILSTGKNMAYLKIAEGCSNHCTYCAIPAIRGPFISRPMEEILEEAEKIAKQGITELIVIAQDTTKYGIDLYGKPKLAELLKKLCKISGFKWIRFLYAYPETITDELIKVVKTEDKICKYFDIPIQHISNPVLKRMNRKSTGESIKELMKKLRMEIPDVILRTTLIVGFPGETEEDFKRLYEFVKGTRFDKLGVFQYSKEEGTPAARLKEQIHPSTKKSRYNKIMKLQQGISKERLEEKVGKTYSVLIEAKSFDGNYYIGRTYMDVPDIDGYVYIRIDDKKEDKINQYVTCKITGVQEYDLIGELV
ncbi:MAG: 30S ribosomal protein S12 methylthiotransferase RimO [Clostridia bacterium]